MTGFTLVEALVVTTVVAILAVAAMNFDAGDRLSDATRQNLAEQGRIFLVAATRLNDVGIVGRAQTSPTGIAAGGHNPLPARGVEHLARTLTAPQDLPGWYDIGSSSSAGVVVTLHLPAGDLGAVAPPDAARRRLDDGSWQWTWRATPRLGSRARQITEALYQ